MSLQHFLLFITVLFCVSCHVQCSKPVKGYFSVIENVRTLPHVYNAIQKNSNTFTGIAQKITKINNLNHLNDELLANEVIVLSANDSTTTIAASTFSNSTEASTFSFPTTTEKWMTVNATTDEPGPSTSTEPATPQPTRHPSLPVGQDCINHVKAVIQGLVEKKKWAIKMIDAAGKLPANVLGGALIWPGGYEECLAVNGATVVNQTNFNVEGKYCLTSIRIPNMPVNALTQQSPSFSVGLCLPKTCTDHDASNLINSALLSVSNNSLAGFVNCKHPDKPYDTRAKLVIAVVSLFIAIMVAGTIYDIMMIQLPKWKEMSQLSEDGLVVAAGNEKTPLIGQNRQIHVQTSESTTTGVLGNILLSFSIYTNATKIWSTKQGAGTLTALNGIRFISMSWVILGHTYAFILSVVDNTFDFMPKMMKRWTFQAIGNATVSVDTFFTLSGILLTYLVMKELKKNDGKINWGKFYFHRFWRLTPPYMLVLMVYVALFPYTGSGPVWPEDGVEPNHCKNSWYYNFFYINNFVDDLNKTCFGWAWYLANDMQFFVISPLIILPLFYSHAAGVAVILAFLIGTWTATGVMSTKWNLSMSFFDGGLDDGKIYTRPYYRMGPYLVGMYTGYLLYKTQCNHRMNKFIYLLGWLIATILALTVLYGPYNDVSNSRPALEIASLYNTVFRTVWGGCVAWVVFACANGYGGFVNTLLSWQPMVPLSRLTYCAYLVHPIIMYHYATNRKTLIHMTDSEMIYEFLGNLVLAYMGAFVASLAFESPMMGLEKIMFKRDRRKT